MENLHRNTSMVIILSLNNFSTCILFFYKMSKRIYSLEEVVEKVMFDSDSNSEPEIDKPM